MTVAELLRSKNITVEVINGLPKDVISHLEGYVTEADTRLQTATSEATKAEEARRQAELERKEIDDYVNNYGTSLTKMSGVEAKNKALVTYLKEIKAKGFEVPDELIVEAPGGPRAVVPGSPAVGENAVDEKKILGRVGGFLGQWLDANNEHIRLFGTPIPDSSEEIGEAAGRARKPVSQYVAEKYGFAAKKKEMADAEQKKLLDAARAEGKAESDREHAERGGSNPNLRAGESSRQPFITKIKSDDFHKSDGPATHRERMNRLREKIHADVATARGA